MLKPAFAFDGRLILDHKELHKIGFQVEVIGKVIAKVYPLPLTPNLPPSLTFGSKTPDGLRTPENILRSPVTKSPVIEKKLANGHA